MARTPHDAAAAQELGEHLTALQPDGVSFDDIAKALFTEGYDVSAETIRKAHRGKTDPRTAPVELLLCLRNFYAVQPEDLGPVAASRMANVLVFSGAGLDPKRPARRAPKKPPESDNSALGCTRGIAGDRAA